MLLVPTTKPETAFDFGVRVFDSWKLGRKGIDDGVLLVVAKADRQLLDDSEVAAADAVDTLIAEGPEKAMSTFNKMDLREAKEK